MEVDRKLKEMKNRIEKFSLIYAYLLEKSQKELDNPESMSLIWSDRKNRSNERMWDHWAWWKIFMENFGEAKYKHLL